MYGAVRQPSVDQHSPVLTWHKNIRHIKDCPSFQLDLSNIHIIHDHLPLNGLAAFQQPADSAHTHCAKKHKTKLLADAVERKKPFEFGQIHEPAHQFDIHCVK